MKGYILLFVFIISSCFCLSQNQGDTISTKNIDQKYYLYLSINKYREQHSEPLTKKDSLNFLFKNNDTLVLLKSYLKPKRVSVPYEFKDSTFLYYYKKVAFNHLGDSISKKTPMKYWKDDIRIFFSKSVSNKTKRDLMSFAKIIDKAVDSLKISEVKHLEDSNYVIYYSGDYEYEPQLRNYKNSDAYYVWWNAVNQIYKGSIKLDTEVYFGEVTRQYKLKELFFKSLGYFTLISDFDCESYFANCYSPNKKLTRLDLELLKYHYSYGICKGTSLEAFEKYHKEAKKYLELSGEKLNFFYPFEDASKQ